MKIWSLNLLDNLSNCLMNLSGDSTGFEPKTSAMPVQCSNQLSYEVTLLRVGQFVGLIFSRERNVVWKKCCIIWRIIYMRGSYLHLISNTALHIKFLKITCFAVVWTTWGQKFNSSSPHCFQFIPGEFVRVLLAKQLEIMDKWLQR